MKRVVLFLFVFASLTGSVAAQEHNMTNHPMDMSMADKDGRQLVNFPPHMRQQLLANMRGHLGALSSILAAIAKGDYGKAGKVADAQLGLNSPSAAGCKVNTGNPEKHQMSGAMNMDEMMNNFMPDGMRKAGAAMHQSASEFAAVAKKAAKTGNGKSAYVALSHVTEQCVACHSAYRVH